ncbi:MAG: SDR family NAD(P)-dependent oxidoreductase [Muribaculaceae bacterium]|nr:SDR family NAD(P)-dependent oxidoreductase [Muribaculaceae bacterium]
MKKIVIMGATSGIGLNVAERLARKGWMVGVAGRRDSVMQLLAEKYPGRVVWRHIDITRPEAGQSLRKLVDKLGGMDVYFHISGVGYENDNLDPTLELATVRTNVTGFTRMIDEAYRYFRDERHGRGHIAAITSVAGTRGIGRLAAYSATKAYQQTYLTALNQLARIEHLKIKFSDIRPGWIRTPLLDNDYEYPLTMTLPYAVPLIVKALKHKQRVAYIDWRWGMLVALWRLIPDWIWVRIPMKINTPASPVATRSNALNAADGEIPTSQPTIQ